MSEVSFTQTVLTNLEQQITEKKITGTFYWHKNKVCGLQRRSLTIRYQITQIMDYLSGKAFKKYRKHYAEHRKALAKVDAMPYFVENKDGKTVNNYNAIGAEYNAILDALKESADIITESGKDKSLKLKQFKTATKAIKDAVEAKLNPKTDAEVIAEAEELKAA